MAIAMLLQLVSLLCQTHPESWWRLNIWTIRYGCF